MVESVLRDGEAKSHRSENGYELVMTTLRPLPSQAVPSNQGPSILAVHSAIPPSARPHVLLIPGGLGTRPLGTDAAYLQLVQNACAQSANILTVCTGSHLLAKTGLLDGRLATSNKRAWRMVTSESPKVTWQSSARWVIDGPYWTSSGVAAGCDMALAFIAHDFGEAVAHAIAKRVEYVWNSDNQNDPFRAAL